ncbi:hypothetical protein C8A00DRAFT_10883 [Chaetomidium leptoderma]|uniref:Flavin-nucleotide-binding protein n=1 Tax=Chaetomidium leptoderma TaxID=669021 RepID=A0AAN6VW81_9PEZI|nr:hypothetical protein C8A00DRAFT_10883 [Chaetomidium leptoderma]
MNVTRTTTTSPSSGSTPQPQQQQQPEVEGLPVTIAASHLDGLVLALTPNSHSYNYRSAILFGHATVVTDVAEKLYAMELITNGIVPQRWAHSRVPPNAAEMQSTSVLRVRIRTGSAKIRTGAPHDEKGDMEDEGLLGRVWTGVVPVHSVLGTPIAGGYNRVGEVPAYLEGWRGEMNRDAEEYAREAVGREVVAKKVAE